MLGNPFLFLVIACILKSMKKVVDFTMYDAIVVKNCLYHEVEHELA